MRVAGKFAAAAVVLLTATVPVAWAQCSAHLAACLDEDASPQRLAVSVWTNDAHCPADGHITLTCVPPEYVGFGYVESFFDVFTTPHRVKPELYILQPLPPYVPFQLVAAVDFDDPLYADLEYIETVEWDPVLGKLRIVHPTPCFGDEVPEFMLPMTAGCFKVCHRIYYVDMGLTATHGRPIITVVPGCGMETNCSYDPCVPGDDDDYVYNIYRLAGQWILEFEYTNRTQYTRCYCVSYISNQPQDYTVHRLAALNEHSQTLDFTLSTELSGHDACGIREVFSYPAGAWIGGPTGTFFTTNEKHTVSIPVGPGSYLPGQQFEIIAYLDYGPPQPCVEYENQWLVEHVRVTTQGGLEAVDVGGECDPSAVHVPDTLFFAAPECIHVCHDIYHIPLDFPGPGTPQVAVYPGCDPGTTPCDDPTCNPGGPYDYRYDLIHVGGSWILEFEYSNPHNEPACYCIEFYNVIPQAREPRVLCALDEANQTFNVSLWSSDCEWPWSGEFTVTSNPPYELDPEVWVESFFDVFCTPRTWEIPVQPGLTANPGENFQIVVECDFFGPGSDPFDGRVYSENVVVTPAGELALWDPSSPCTGDNVPVSMIPGESQCFKVCHRVYETVLFCNEGGGRPVIHVTPGCFGPPQDSCTVEPCVPGGPADYVYDVYHNGVDWILRFEYSNPYVEPVCYCVTYTGNVPWDCETFELAALDEAYQTFDVSVRTFSNEGYECTADGIIQLFSNPPGAQIPLPTWPFAGVGEEWYTSEAPVGPGSFVGGETFQLVAWIQYGDPDYPDVWLTEDVIVDLTGESLSILDVGGECTGDTVPPWMEMNESACFKVCHRIYHIGLGWYDETYPPIVTVTPGCYGPPQDSCAPDPACTPGGPFDYRYDLWWRGEFWELEFEYSNEQIEPVCYCVTVNAVPCLPVTDLVIQWPDTLTNNIRLGWTCPQWGQYIIYYTTNKNNDGNPPGPGWVEEGRVIGNAGEVRTWQPPSMPTHSYRNYVIKVNCEPTR